MAAAVGKRPKIPPRTDPVWLHLSCPLLSLRYNPLHLIVVGEPSAVQTSRGDCCHVQRNSFSEAGEHPPYCSHLSRFATALRLRSLYTSFYSDTNRRQDFDRRARGRSSADGRGFDRTPRNTGCQSYYCGRRRGSFANESASSKRRTATNGHTGTGIRRNGIRNR